MIGNSLPPSLPPKFCMFNIVTFSLEMDVVTDRHAFLC